MDHIADSIADIDRALLALQNEHDVRVCEVTDEYEAHIVPLLRARAALTDAPIPRDVRWVAAA